MSEHLFLITIGMVPVTVLVIFGMKYFSAFLQARIRAAAENAYRELAEKAVAVESGNATSLSAMQSELAQINARLASVEKMLKEV